MGAFAIALNKIYLIVLLHTGAILEQGSAPIFLF
ncbi:hypothetical protein BACCIP111883_03489 [Sutcliffiella rhizosphaerae]|uniref:Uncharacterized protein n=1 Tax=Sutcliffiella rhizosphaerae TaxID=2880967 RepID=A0ABN8AHS3_9BACI|nr:hypothetical protein BACCIP111883_03489 [Sutcliffiella rhizosphaerae]